MKRLGRTIANKYQRLKFLKMFKPLAFSIIFFCCINRLSAQCVNIAQYTYEAYLGYIEDADTFLLANPDSITKVFLNFERIERSDWNKVWSKICGSKNLKCLSITNCDFSKLDFNIPIEFIDSIRDLRIQLNAGQNKWLNVVSKCKNLYFLGCSFDKVDNRVTSLTGLHYLLIMDSKMRKLPSEITELKQLEYLSLERCKNLTTVPPSLSKLENLCVINCRDCQRLEKLELCYYDRPQTEQEAFNFRKPYAKLGVIFLNDTDVKTFTGLGCLWNNELKIFIDIDYGDHSFSTLDWIIAKEFLPKTWSIWINDEKVYKDGVYRPLSDF
jgi:hypothetical protein